jgi:hypothetical protein
MSTRSTRKTVEGNIQLILPGDTTIIPSAQFFRVITGKELYNNRDNYLYNPHRHTPHTHSMKCFKQIYKIDSNNVYHDLGHLSNARIASYMKSSKRNKIPRKYAFQFTDQDNNTHSIYLFPRDTILYMHCGLLSKHTIGGRTLRKRKPGEGTRRQPRGRVKGL